MPKVSRGFILPALGIGVYGAIAAAVVILGLGVAVRVQTSRLESVKQDYAAFKAQVRALGEVAAAKAKLQEAADKSRKAKADDENQRLRTDNAALSRRLRQSLASRSAVSQLAPTAGRADLICFSRPDLDSAIGRYQSGVLGIAEKGAEATINLDTGRDWIREISAGK